MPTDSLLEIARRACCRYARRIEDIGDLPYEFVRPILLKIQNPEQLYRIEQSCPQIIGEDAEIWLNLIKRDIPNWDTKPHRPSNPKNWYKVYRKLRQDVQTEKAANEAKLKAALSSMNTRKEGTTAQVVSGRSLPNPRIARRRTLHRDYKGVQKMSFLEKIRKEAKDAKSANMNRPTHELVRRSVGVKKAPAAFVEDLRREKQARLPIVSPKPQSQNATPQHLAHASGVGGYSLTSDREARLLAMKTGKRPEENHRARENIDSGNGQHTGLSAQFLEDHDLDSSSDDDEELMGRLQTTKASSMTISPQPKVLKRKAPAQLFVAAHGSKKRPAEPF